MPRLLHFLGFRFADGSEVVRFARWAPFTPERFMVPISVKSLSGPQSYSAAGRIRSFTNTSDLIESQLRDLPTCSAVPQPATLLHVPKNEKAVYEQT